MYIDVAGGERPWREIYRLCIGFINPRPIALVATLSEDGTPNLAPFSFYNMASANPPVVLISPGLHRDRRPKDTLVNIRARGEFSIATVTPELVRPMVATAAELPYGQSEFAFSGLTPIPATKIAAPLVKESPISLECRLRQIVSFGDGPGASSVVFGDIMAIHVDNALVTPEGVIDPHKLTTVGRLGGAWYADAASPYELHIPRVDEAK